MSQGLTVLCCATSEQAIDGRAPSPANADAAHNVQKTESANVPLQEIATERKFINLKTAYCLLWPPLNMCVQFCNFEAVAVVAAVFHSPFGSLKALAPADALGKTKRIFFWAALFG